MCVFLCSLRMNQAVHFFFWGGVSAFLGIIQCSSVSFPDLVLVTLFSSCLVVLLSFFSCYMLLLLSFFGLISRIFCRGGGREGEGDFGYCC